MSRLICTGIVSVDGFVNDENGSFAWAEPDAEVHQFVNDLERSVSTTVYGRRLYEVMSYWEHPAAESSPVELDFAGVWQAAEKVVVSTTLAEVNTARTRLVRELDPAALSALIENASGDVSIGGPTLASAAYAAGLVDEVQLITVPYVAGGGTRFFPSGFASRLRLVDEHRFANGTVFTRYAVA